MSTKIVDYILQHNLIQILNRIKSEMSSLQPVVKHLPNTVILDVTNECNLCCTFCSTDSYREKTRTNNLSYGTAQKVLRKFKMADFVGFCGAGEPLLNKDLFRMIKFAKDLKMKTYMTTNGILIESRFKEILQNPPDTLEISLKEINEDKYLSIIKNKSFKLGRMLENIAKLSAASNRPKKIVLSYVCDKDRILVAPEVVAIARKLKIDEVWFQNLIPDPLLKNHEKCLFETDRERLKGIYDFENNHAFVKGPKLYNQDTSIRHCGILFKSIRVGCDGGVSACPRSVCPSLEYGNVLSNGNIFNSKHFKEFRSEMLSLALPLRYQCIYCDERLPK